MERFNKKFKKTAIFTFVIILIIIGISIAFDSGYRITPNGLTKTMRGSITLSIPHEGSRVFLNNRKKLETNKPNQTVSFDKLPASAYSLLVAKTDEWPWFKTVNITGNNPNYTLNTFTIPQEISMWPIETDDTSYEQIHNALTQTTLPSTELKLKSFDDKMAIWVDNARQNNLFAEWLGEENEIPNYFCQNNICNSVSLVFSGSTPIRSLSFYGDRSDVVMIAVHDGIYALEINSIAPQNFQPLMIGKEPIFLPDENNRLFILDDDVLGFINLP